VFGGGFMSHRDALGRGPNLWTYEGAFTSGGGVRVQVSDRVYLGGGVRIGWELRLSTAAHVSVSRPGR
jgi:hypothetical protein